MALAYVGQEDFAAGILRASARDSEPGVGLTAVRNGLFDDDGDVYRRGGDAFFSSSTADGPITFLWSGFLSDVPKTIAITATKSYRVSVTGVMTELGTTGIARPVQGAVVGERLWLPGGLMWDGGNAIGAWTSHAHVCAVADRLVYADGNKIGFSSAGDPTVFAVDDYHELPDGVLVEGMMAIRDTCLLFSSYGVWALNNMSFDLTDAEGNAQQTLSRIIPEMSLLHEAGVAEWAGKLVVPAVDRVFLVDASSAPIPISDSVSPIYMRNVLAGYKPGGAKVFRNHYFLPFLDATNNVKSTLVCRLNRPVRGRQIYYPWSTIDGHAGSNRCFDVRLIEQRPTLSGGGIDGRISDVGVIFSTAHESDAGGMAINFQVELRDLITGNGQPNHVKHMRVWLTVEGMENADSWRAAVSTGSVAQTYEALLHQTVPGHEATYAELLAAYDSYEEMLRGGLTSATISDADPDRYWTEVGQGYGDNDGTDPARFDFGRAIRTRYIRGWIGTDKPCTRFAIHKIEFGVRGATHQR